MRRIRHIPASLALMLVAVVAILANVIAIVVNTITTELMAATTPFAHEVQAFQAVLIESYRPMSFFVVSAIVVAYLVPILKFFLGTDREHPSPLVQRRVINAPFFVATAGFIAWLVSIVLVVGATLWKFATWSPELVSQQVFSPLVSGFLAGTSTYLLLDWLFRGTIVPRVFPQGRLYEASRGRAIGVQARFFIYLTAVAFLPLFTVIGLIRAASTRLAAGYPADRIMAALDHSSGTAFVLFILLSLLLTVLLGRTLTWPLAQMAAALRRVQEGDLEVSVEVGSADEVGLLEDGVNAMVAALREKDHILAAFGRVVEPAVRDHLLSGNLRLGGEMRTATVLFVDLRGYTSISERMSPDDVVSTLNDFFTVMTQWVRECGGFVDKFIGDAMLVVFGLFEPVDEQGDRRGAAAGLRCALGIGERLAELNGRRARLGQPELEVTIGVHSGRVLAGTIGAEDRHDYTVIGDTVNVAARLQHLCKEEGCRLLVSEATYELARAQGLRVELTAHDPVSLRGRSEPVPVYRSA